MCRANLAAFVYRVLYRAGYRTVHLLANWACVVLIVLALSAMHQLCMCLCVSVCGCSFASSVSSLQMFALKLMFAGVVHMLRWPRLSIMHGMQA